MNKRTIPHSLRIILILLTGVLVFPSFLSGCGGPSPEDLAAVDYTPIERADWETSTPATEGLDPEAVARMYYDAARLDTIYGLVVIKNNRIVAEDYFNGASVDQLDRRASVTKSYTSALVGIALDHGYISSIDQKMLDFFPDVAPQITDPRKWDITIRDMLEMRSGYPWEEDNEQAWNAMWSGEYLSQIAAIPLTADPGTKFQYSNLTAHWTGIVAARATGMDLMSLGNEYLFGPLGVHPGENWNRDVDGYYIGAGDILFTARDMARFGQLYLDEGMFDGHRLLPAQWIRDSLQTYTINEFEVTKIGRFKDMGYGYFWWSAEAGDHHINFAWGHGGNLIVLVHDLDMVVVVTADPFYGPDVFEDAWSHEKANIELVADFVASLPAE